MAPAPSSGDIVIMGINLNTINYWYVFYVLFSIVIVAGGAFSLYSSANLGRTVIYVIGVSLIMLFFGMRWFGNIPSTSKLWPPTINMCPDYLTFVRGTNISGCVDTIGVSNNSGFPKIERSEMAAPTSTKVFGGDAKYTSASVTSTAATAASIQAICNACKTGGLTWEGVWDGDTCLALSRFTEALAISKSLGCPAAPV
jgi:hypothetical protein